MKYRLIKEYPGSPKLGDIIEMKEDTNMCYFEGLLIMYPNKYPEFWEKVVEKDYKILSLARFCSIKPTITDVSDYGDGYIEALLKCDKARIHSVKRLSDGEIFTIGDVCSPKDYDTSNSHPITKFELILKGTTLRVISKNWYLGIDNIEKSKQSLFTTEDGVDIYVGDKYWVLNTKLNDWIFEENAVRDNINYFYKDKSYAKNTGIYYFSSKEKAEEYILMNKPCLSLNDVLPYIGFPSHDIKSIKELVKSKIKQNEHC